MRCSAITLPPFTFGASRRRHARRSPLVPRARRVAAAYLRLSCPAGPRSYPPAGPCEWPAAGQPAAADHDPSAMLHAPLPTVFYADQDGDTQFAIDQPSTLFEAMATLPSPRSACTWMSWSPACFTP